MEDVPQPASEPYAIGDRVRVYLGVDDPDAKFHGRVCEIVDVLIDDLDADTGRRLDAYSYTVADVASTEPLPVVFRHHDLVPTEERT